MLNDSGTNLNSLFMQRAPNLIFDEDGTLYGFVIDDKKRVINTIIDWLTQLLCNISRELWDEYKGRLRAYIEEQYHQLSRNQMMLLANTIEIMYTKGYDAINLLKLITQRIPLSNVEFDPDSADNVRIKLAKVAYATNQYNFYEKFAAVQALKYHLKTSGRKYLLGMLNYYKGLCLKMAGVSIDCKDASYYILKSKNRGFGLADTYFSYMLINFETSKTS